MSPLLVQLRLGARSLARARLASTFIVAALALCTATSTGVFSIVLGVIGSLIAGQAVAGLLFGIAPNDAPTLIGVSVLMAAVSLVASWIPARHAARVDPALVLSAG